MKHLIIVLTMAFSFCKAEISKAEILPMDSVHCESAYEAEVLVFGEITVHKLALAGGVYYCAYLGDSTNYWSRDSTQHYDQGYMWTLWQSFAVPISDGYDCFLDELEYRGINIPVY